MRILRSLIIILIISIFPINLIAAERTHELLNPGWSFKGFFGKFDRASLQRGYQVYTEVCASCHSLKHLS